MSDRQKKSMWHSDERWCVGNRDYALGGQRVAEHKKRWLVWPPVSLRLPERYFKSHGKAMRFAVRMAQKTSGGTML